MVMLQQMGRSQSKAVVAAPSGPATSCGWPPPRSPRPPQRAGENLDAVGSGRLPRPG
jgi:hypothetical protein